MGHKPKLPLRDRLLKSNQLWLPCCHRAYAEILCLEHQYSTRVAAWGAGWATRLGLIEKCETCCWKLTSKLQTALVKNMKSSSKYHCTMGSKQKIKSSNKGAGNVTWAQSLGAQGKVVPKKRFQTRSKWLGLGTPPSWIWVPMSWDINSQPEPEFHFEDPRTL